MATLVSRRQARTWERGEGEEAKDSEGKSAVGEVMTGGAGALFVTNDPDETDERDDEWEEEELVEANVRADAKDGARGGADGRLARTWATQEATPEVPV